MKKPVLINFFAGPGSGKSTTASGLFYKMKMMGLNVEFAPEYCKDLVYEGRSSTLKNQLYILGKQFNRIERLREHVNFIITDSPLLFCSYYAGTGYPPSYYELVLDIHSQFDNRNYFVERTKKYSEIGRTQTELEAIEIDKKLRAMLDNYGIQYDNIKCGDIGIQKVLDDLKDDSNRVG